jgi:hypothetical protein
MHSAAGKMPMRKICLFTIVVFIAGVSAHAQPSAVCPSGLVCLSQEAANKAAENARLIPALEGKIAALEDGMKQKDVSIAELKAVNLQNVADLTARMHRTEVSLAEKTGTLIACEASSVRNMAIIDGLLKKRKVQVGLINF